MISVPSEILQKIERYCAYQERCRYDVEKKLKTYNLSEKQISEIVEILENEKFIDEERFAEIFVRSKLKSFWGRNKIIAALSSKHVKSDIINNVITSINLDDYADNMNSAANKWLRSNKNKSNQKERLIRFLISKGYAFGEISSFVRNIDGRDFE